MASHSNNPKSKSKSKSKPRSRSAEPAVQSITRDLADMPTDTSYPAAPAESFDFNMWTAAHLVLQKELHRQIRSNGGAGLRAQDLIGANKVLEVHFADGSAFYTDPVAFAQRYAEPAALRGMDSSAAGVPIPLPFDLSGEGSGVLRGKVGGEDAAAAHIDRYAISELTEPTALDKVIDVAESLRRSVQRWLKLDKVSEVGLLGAKLCAAYEAHVLDKGVGRERGVLLARAGDGWKPLDLVRLVFNDEDDRDGRPILLFLHGTASSTKGSYHALWTPVDGSPLPLDFERLLKSHRLLAWEHRSLTASPVDNTIDLIDALKRAGVPATRRIDLVSHSRGGLIGELFNLRSTTAEQLARARTSFAAAFADHADLDQIGPLFDRLAEASGRWPVGSFVRVACPARGTMLADGRTDLFLSLLLRTVQLAIGGGPVVEPLVALVKALVSVRTDAKELPGLEAMIPGSALTRALAGCDAKLADRLYVIAGDTAAKGLKGVFTLIADVFYGWHDHDYVVHTKSMFGGLRRAAIAPLSLRIEDAAVSHFAYFGASSVARAALMKALAGGIEGFNPLGDDEQRTRSQRGALQLIKANPRSRRRFTDWLSRVREPTHARRPVLIVLAGIMGSELARRDAQADSPVWLSARAMLGGQLAELALTDGDLLPSGLLAYGYERLIVEADQCFNVLPVPFDWRQPIAASGGRLRDTLKQVLASIDPALPVHLIAHSMGGLVARHALFVDDSDKGALWQTLSRRGGRLLQLGTPNRGSYAPAVLLLGQHSLANALGLFANKVSRSNLSRFGASFQGLLEMLPQSGDARFGDLFDIRNWDRIAKVDSRLATPDSNVLKQAAAYVRSDAFVRSLDALKSDTNVLYVAGQGETPMQMRVRAPRFGDGLPGMREIGIEFLAGLQGDGTVSWESRLAPDRTWYAPCEHGTLPDDTDCFGAYFELLQDGQTRHLTSEPPQKRGSDADGLHPLRAPLQASLLPTDEDLAAMLVPPAARKSQGEAIAIRIVHGGLDYARFPLMVGHYLNEHVTGAARRVDEKLGGQFRRVLDLKLFVGAARTAHYLRPNNHAVNAPAYPGAIMLGLGSVGELTPASLADTVARGVLRYVFEHLHRDPFSPGAQEPVDIRLSSVLVGTHIQAVSVRDSLAGLLRGVWRAAQMMPGLGSASRPVRLRELELIEIDETIALDAAYELQQLLERGEWSTRFDWAAGVLETRQGHQRGYRSRAGRSTWQRLVVRQDPLGGLNFALIGSQARVEATQVYSDVSSLRRYLDRISDGRSQGSDRITSPTDTRLGSVLFQLLLPNDLKSRLANLDNTVLVLDDQTAAYPWELLTPPQEALGQDDLPRPFAVQAGLVRQRVTVEFRLLPQMQSGFRALVIGAPSTTGWVDEKGSTLKFGDLPGARAEAQMVRGLLDQDTRTWVVVPEASTGTAAFAGEAIGFEHIRTLLLEQPYRLLHLCGHGVVDHWMRQIGSGSEVRALRKSGMVLSNQELLGAVDVEQMSTTPEFVFINCCYSGRDGDGGTGTLQEASGGQRAALAASLALKFIDMGAKAVIAAGWQVDDTAALLFAKMFYENLLSGTAFGEAARTARAEVHARYCERSNTWGAYQCYGDPSWTLAAGSGLARQGASQQNTSCLDGAERTMSAGELAARIAQVQAVAGDEPAANVCARIDRLRVVLEADPRRRDWLRDSRVRTEIGLAYRELGEHKLAAEYLQMSARATYSDMRIGDLEQLVNSLARVSDPADPREGMQARAAAKTLLTHLNRLGKSGAGSWPLESRVGKLSSPREPRAASERLSLLGGVQLRAVAELLENAQASPQVAPLLRKAAKAFAQSFRRKLREDDDLDRRNYALSNALLAAALLQTIERNVAQPRTLCDTLGRIDYAAGKDTQAIVNQWLSQASDHLDEVEARANRSTFWNYATAIELRTARGLFAYTHNDPSYKVDQIEKDIEFVRNGIDRICTLWPSPNNLDSMRHRFRLIKLVEAQFGSAAPGSMMSAVAKLAVEANDRLQLRSREVG